MADGTSNNGLTGNEFTSAEAMLLNERIQHLKDWLDDAQRRLAILEEEAKSDRYRTHTEAKEDREKFEALLSEVGETVNSLSQSMAVDKGSQRVIRGLWAVVISLTGAFLGKNWEVIEVFFTNLFN